MISRIWHGWTTPANADAYEDVLLNEVIVGIRGREIPGFREIQVFRRELDDEVEFVTVMWFDTLDAVRDFAGEDHERAVVPEEARRVLARFDARSQHYQVRERMTAGQPPAPLLARLGPDAPGLLDRVLDDLGIQEVPLGEIRFSRTDLERA